MIVMAAGIILAILLLLFDLTSPTIDLRCAAQMGHADITIAFASGRISFGQ